MVRFLLVLASILLFWAPAPAAEPKPADVDPDAKPVKVPFTLLKSRHMLVDVKINDKGPYKLIFDTGAPIMLVNNRLAKDAGLLKNNPSPFALFGNGGEMPVKKLELGGVAVENLKTVVMDHPTVDALATALKLPIDGIVGHTFFARFRTTVDYEAKELTFVPNGYRPGDLTESITKMMMSGGKDGPPKTFAPAGLWGAAVGKDTDDEEDGVVVREVFAGSAAAEAGLKPGDRLLTVDGRWTDSIIDAYVAVGAVKPGTTVPATVRRGKATVELKVTPRGGL